jgi:transposase InsO family protein
MNLSDKTVERNYIQRYLFLFEEYAQVKQKKHSEYRFLKDFYESHALKRQVFLKFYNRYKNSGFDQEAILPQKRGPKWLSRRPSQYIESCVLKERRKGNNKFEIHQLLLPVLGSLTPSPSGIYTICKRHNLNILNRPMKEIKKKIIKQKAGELGHIDAHHLGKGILAKEPHNKYYLLAVVDSCTRLAWAEVCSNLTSLEVMFATMRCFYRLQDQFGVRFKEILSDNGKEFSGKRATDTMPGHPFERLLTEMQIKHRYTRPYRPQTNGKVERLWRTIEEDLIEGTHFESLEQLKNDLQDYLLYYNYERPHQGINGKSPADFLKNLSAN